MSNDSYEFGGYVSKNGVFDKYAVNRHKRPSENFKDSLSAVEAYRDAGVPVQQASILDKFRNLKGDLKQNCPAFVDLSAILLALSLLLYLMYSVPGTVEIPVTTEIAEPEVFSDELLDLTGINSSNSVVSFSELQDFVQSQNIAPHVKVLDGEQGLSLQLNSRVLFNDGAYDLARSGKSVLSSLLSFLLGRNNHISVEVHTSGLELLYGEVTSEMLLSEHRAKALLSYFVSQGYSKSDVSITAHGNSLPLSAGTTFEDRERNARVLFGIE